MWAKYLCRMLHISFSKTKAFFSLLCDMMQMEEFIIMQNQDRNHQKGNSEEHAGLYIYMYILRQKQLGGSKGFEA